MLCLAEVTLYHHGEDIAVRAGQLCLVQGDREDESAPEGFVWCLAGQLNGLVPASHLKRLANVAGFTCQAIYDFTAADSGELSMIAGEYVMVQPSIEDPTGWVSATHKSSGECGLVPQSYVEPSGVTVSSPSAKTPQSSAAGAMATLIESGARVLREEATPDGDAPTLSAPTARDATGEKEDEDDEEELVMIGETPPGEKAQAVIPDSDSESPARPPVLTASRPARLEFPVSPVARHPFVPGQTRQMAAKDARPFHLLDVAHACRREVKEEEVRNRLAAVATSSERPWQLYGPYVRCDAVAAARGPLSTVCSGRGGCRSLCSPACSIAAEARHR